MNKKGRKVFSILLTIIVVIFLYLGKNNSNDKFTSINQGLDKAISWIDQTLDLSIYSKEILTTNLDNSKVKVHFIDVDQAEAILIQTENSNILIDAGEANAGQTLVNYLNKAGVEYLDLVIATHPHADHIGGMVDIIENFDIGQVAMPEIPDDLIPTSNTFTNFLLALENKDLTIFSLDDSSNYLFDDARLTFLAPIYAEEEPIPDLNNLSTVVRLDIDEISFLFTGDAEKWLELKLIEHGKNVNVDILNIAHHGSKTSTCDDFLNKVSPSVAVISCGVDNSYNHPHKDVIKKLTEDDITIFRTDLHQTIIIETDGKQIATITEKS